jgi:hypothetical protein
MTKIKNATLFNAKRNCWILSSLVGDTFLFAMHGNYFFVQIMLLRIFFGRLVEPYYRCESGCVSLTYS